jgi:hypothetical protein
VRWVVKTKRQVLTNTIKYQLKIGRLQVAIVKQEISADTHLANI